MAQALRRMVRRRGALPALVTALAIGFFLLTQSALTRLVGVLSFVGIDPERLGPEGLYPADPFAIQFDGFWWYALGGILPIVFGVFISLWVIAPIADELTLRFVITRAVLAVAVALVLLYVTAVVVSVWAAVGPLEVSFFGNSFPGISVDFPSIGESFVVSIATSVSAMLVAIPAIVLGAVMLWVWLRAHPRSHAVYGLIDEL